MSKFSLESYILIILQYSDLAHRLFSPQLFLDDLKHRCTFTAFKDVYNNFHRLYYVLHRKHIKLSNEVDTLKAKVIILEADAKSKDESIKAQDVKIFSLENANVTLKEQLKGQDDKLANIQKELVEIRAFMAHHTTRTTGTAPPPSPATFPLHDDAGYIGTPPYGYDHVTGKRVREEDTFL